MDEYERLRSRIKEAVAMFEAKNMALRPESVAVELHPPYLVVILRGAVCAAERKLAQEQASREMLERLYAEVFEVVRRELEGIVSDILSQRVTRSRIHADHVLGDVIVTFVIAERSSAAQRQAMPAGPNGKE